MSGAAVAYHDADFAHGELVPLGEAFEARLREERDARGGEEQGACAGGVRRTATDRKSEARNDSSPMRPEASTSPA